MVGSDYYDIYHNIFGSIHNGNVNKIHICSHLGGIYMIIGNILKFGYGDISVHSSGIEQVIRFREFKPPGKCGESLLSKNIEYTSDEIALEISYEEYCDMRQKIKYVLDKETFVFEFKGYIFDFSNYNEASVKVVSRNLENAISGYFRCIAC